MKLVWAAIDPQQADAEPKCRISGCSRALPGSLWEKKGCLSFLSSPRPGKSASALTIKASHIVVGGQRAT